MTWIFLLSFISLQLITKVNANVLRKFSCSYFYGWWRELFHFGQKRIQGKYNNLQENCLNLSYYKHKNQYGLAPTLDSNTTPSFYNSNKPMFSPDGYILHWWYIRKNCERISDEYGCISLHIRIFIVRKLILSVFRLYFLSLKTIFSLIAASDNIIRLFIFTNNN